MMMMMKKRGEFPKLLFEDIHVPSNTNGRIDVSKTLLSVFFFFFFCFFFFFFLRLFFFPPLSTMRGAAGSSDEEEARPAPSTPTRVVYSHPDIYEPSPGADGRDRTPRELMALMERQSRAREALAGRQLEHDARMADTLPLGPHALEHGSGHDARVGHAYARGPRGAVAATQTLAEAQVQTGSGNDEHLMLHHRGGDATAAPAGAARVTTAALDYDDADEFDSDGSSAAELPLLTESDTSAARQHEPQNTEDGQSSGHSSRQSSSDGGSSSVIEDELGELSADHEDDSVHSAPAVPRAPGGVPAHATTLASLVESEVSLDFAADESSSSSNVENVQEKIGICNSDHHETAAANATKAANAAEAVSVASDDGGDGTGGTGRGKTPAVAVAPRRQRRPAAAAAAPPIAIGDRSKWNPSIRVAASSSTYSDTTASSSGARRRPRSARGGGGALGGRTRGLSEGLSPALAVAVEGTTARRRYGMHKQHGHTVHDNEEGGQGESPRGDCTTPASEGSGDGISGTVRARRVAR
jgi:hypothetical protein